jgi:ketosteroid isomerase-like protein
MPERNLELMRRFVEAFNARDAQAIIALSDPSIEYHAALGTAVGGGVFHGHDGLLELFRAIEDVWDELRIEPEAYFELGEHALVFAAQYGRGRQSGAEVAMPIAGVVRWRDGLIVYAKGYPRREDALRELGVTEHELEPIPP